MNSTKLKRKGTALLSLLLLVTIGQGQEASLGHSKSAGSWIVENIILVIGLLVFLFAIWVISDIIRKMLEAQSRQLLEEKGIVAKSTSVMDEEVPLWKRINDWAWDLVPVSAEKSIDLGHDFDGIRELDNKLPPWWLGLMYGSMIFAVIYMYQYHWSGSGWSSENEYIAEMKAGDEIKNAYLDKMANAINENNVVALTDPEDLSAGAAVFKRNCAACHGVEGQGLVGPNLTDDYWLKGGGIKNVFETIKYGVPEKGMISWKSQLKPETMQQVASYILTLQGTSPPNPKAKEGELYIPE